MTERELFRVRLRFLDLLKSFFMQEPDAEMMGRWRGTFTALAREQISPSIDSSVKECCHLLNTRRLPDLQKEYYLLFSDPFGAKKVNTTASYYLDGHSFGQTLVSLKSFLAQVQLVKGPDVKESEDALVVMLDILISLVEEEKETGSPQARGFQTRLLAEYLAPFVGRFNIAMAANENADFYSACSRFLGGYLDLEKGLSNED